MNKNIKRILSGILLCGAIIAAMAVTSMLLVSCSETDMDITKIEQQPQIVVYCFPCSERDTTCITLLRSVPITKSEMNNPYGIEADSLRLHNADVSFMQNGVAKEVKYAAEETGTVPAGCYYVVGKIATGDKIELKAAADGLQSVSAETVIPPLQPIKSIRVTTAVHDQTEYKQLLVDVDGAKMSGGYYAVTVSIAGHLTAESIDGTAEERDFDLRIAVNTEDEPLIAPSQTDTDLFSFEHYFHNDFYIFNGSNITTDSYTLRLNVNTWWTPSWEYDTNYTVANARYVVHLYRIDSPLYKFLKSVNDMESNDLAKYGLAPVLPTHSNISGGTGVLGGCGVEKGEISIEIE